MWKLMLIAGAGSFIGGSLRFLINKAFPWDGATLPWSTLLVNMAGCLIIGIILGVAGRFSDISQSVMIFLTVGICGGLTTFSTFINENLLLLTSGRLIYFIIYSCISFVGGILLVWLGRRIIEIY